MPDWKTQGVGGPFGAVVQAAQQKCARSARGNYVPADKVCTPIDGNNYPAVWEAFTNRLNTQNKHLVIIPEPQLSRVLPHVNSDSQVAVVVPDEETGRTLAKRLRNHQMRTVGIEHIYLATTSNHFRWEKLPNLNAAAQTTAKGLKREAWG